MAVWKPIPGETPIDDISGLKPKGVTTRAQFNDVEARNIRKVDPSFCRSTQKPLHFRQCGNAF